MLWFWVKCEEREGDEGRREKTKVQVETQQNQILNSMLGFCCCPLHSFHFRGLSSLDFWTGKLHWLNLRSELCMSPFPVLTQQALCGMNYAMQNTPLRQKKSKKGCLRFQNPKFYHIALAPQNRWPLVLEANRVLKAYTLGVKARVPTYLHNAQERYVTGDQPAIVKTYAVYRNFIYFFLFVRPRISQ